MTRARRLSHLETQWRPARVAAVLARIRQGAPSDLRAVMVRELTGVDRATARACLDQFTNEELAVLAGPRACAYLDALSDAELTALVSRESAAMRRCVQAIRRQG